MRSALSGIRVGAAGVLLACVMVGGMAGCKSDSAKSNESGTVYEAGHDLGNFVGHWNVIGWSLGANNQHTAMQGTAHATREKNYFVKMDVNFPDTASNAAVDGSVLFSQAGGRCIRLTTWFSSNPALRQYEGTMSGDGKSVEFKDRGSGRELRLKIRNPDSWDAEVWKGGVQIELYTFTRAGM